MIQNCLIQLEMAKKNSAADGGFWQYRRHRCRLFSFPCRHIQFSEFKEKIGLLKLKN